MIIYCFEPTYACRANACFLLAAFMVLHHSWSPEQASAIFICPSLLFSIKPFRDAKFIDQTFDLSIHDCLVGLTRAMSLAWYDQNTFDSKSLPP